jgi:predicted nicotinamide N-methyase
MLDNAEQDARDPQAFIRAHTVLASPPLLPEIKLYLATEMTPLWWATETWLAEKGIEPPFCLGGWTSNRSLHFG